MHDELLDVQDVAQLLKVNPRTVLRMTDRGDLVAVKVGRRWRYRNRDIDSYLQTQVDGQQVDGQLKPSGYQQHMLSPQGVHRSPLAGGSVPRRDLPIEAEKKLLEIEKQRVEQLRVLVDIETKRIAAVLETAKKMVKDVQLEENVEIKEQRFRDTLDAILQRLDPASTPI